MNGWRGKRGCWLWLAGAPLFILLVLWAADNLWPLPLNEVNPARVVVADDGTPLWRFADDEGIWRYPVTIEEVSPRYLEALINYEDRWFWRHPGVNPFSVARAAWQDLTAGRVISGGSTLTMQVARLLDPHPRTFGGKIRQLWRALQLEWHLSKRDILTLYLNRAPFGGTLQGVGAASWAYFGKSPARLSYADAALLAVLPQAPSRLRPDRWPVRAEAARNKVLDRMAVQGVWPAETVRESREEPVWLAPRQMPQLAPLFARMMLGKSQSDKIVTTLDAGLQRQLEDLARAWKGRLPARSSLAMIVVDHTDMSVRGWVGSVDLNDDSRFGHVDMVTAIRSPGSILKPFVYGLALDDALIHPASLLQDVPRRTGDYRPGNFDSGFHGPVSMSDALVRSLNLPAVQVLEAYGPKRFAAKLRNVGLPLYLPSGAAPNLSLILGGAGARLDEMAAAYSAFARHGKAAKLRFQPDDPLRERPLMSPGAAWIIRRIMADEAQPLPDNALPRIAPLAWKTGTSYGYRDAWAIGVNARYIIGIWTGRPDGTPVVGQFGFASAVPLLNQVNNLLLAHAGRLPEDPRPQTVSRGVICWPGGQSLPAGDSNCRRRLATWLLDDSQPPTLLLPEQEGVNGIRFPVWLDDTGLRVAADCPQAREHTFIVWPRPLEPWLPSAERRSARLPTASALCPPLQGSNAAPLMLSEVREGAVIRQLPGQKNVTLPVSTTGGKGRRWWFLNGEPVNSEKSHLSLLLNSAGRYQLVVMDESGQVATVNFELMR
ncbi:peptidoglycan glycosyltransferase PbpC [Salmonella enterica]|uniref:peptidoglycan glycosyltransferase n=1 Tax=Salmonella enterica subsp. VII serovar 40:z4,z24:[z39] TaxID=1967625 RepID=A0A731XZN0_SALEE|nr:peptidoglycan glycosyltransferase PbpC [Salmonella enterica]EDO5297535.1 penicillin-binding protein 1C [Salmonella enterica subsp. houtenae serovar 40:z4,z24:-]MCR5947344.1 penicillin-binding protein 1C [Salmonella enterica subsp. houtenae]QUZ24614.1 peptidoglycan glycosyltransferase PbpC [Salmonella enterica subsp. VII str. CFSAN000554]HAE4732934.1 peptidoglycan glycosyltransferase PbpC [Salmonella enterica subsp. VII serovar 40:z4,z24:[z39]]HCA3677196.1 peptidoglycan glycosyltransferase P